MNIYVESNFVLELAFAQEQQASCEAIVRTCEAGAARLVIPAYCLVEPYETLVRYHKKRRKVKEELDDELRHLTRADIFALRAVGLQGLAALLVDSAAIEARRLEEVRFRLISICDVIALDASILSAATGYQKRNDLSPQDSVVYASVLNHLSRSPTMDCCFLNRNSRDFDDPDIVQELRRHACKMISRFDHGFEFVRNQINAND